MRQTLHSSMAGPALVFGRPPAPVPRPDRALAGRRSDWYALVARLLLEAPTRQGLFELARSIADAGHVEDGARHEVAAVQFAIDAALASPAGWTDLQRQFARLPRDGDGPEPSLLERLDCGSRVPGAGGPGLDHVATELKMLSVLCFSEMGAWGDRQGAQARELAARELRLLDEHVLRCLPRLVDLLAELADGFYVALARYLAHACVQDRRHLAGISPTWGVSSQRALLAQGG